jgi:hypothetical protein
VSAGACPSLADLLLAAEEALPPSVLAEVARHVQECAACQVSLAKTDSLLGRLRQVMKRLEERDTTDAAELRYERFVAALHVRKQQHAVRPTRSLVRRWMPIAASLLIGALVLFEFQRPVIAADDFVKQAAIVERHRPAGSRQRLRVTMTPGHRPVPADPGSATFSIEEELTDGMVTTTSAFAPVEPPVTLVKMLSGHRFDWEHPLSVEHFHAWRRSLARKHDTVIDTPYASDIVLRTITDDDSDLHEVELTVDRGSYRVKRLVLRFEGGVLLEIAELTHWTRQPLPFDAARPAMPTLPTIGRPLPAPAAPLPVAPLPVAPPPDLNRWLAQRFGDSGAREQFMPGLRRETSIIRQHLVALRDLSSRYPGADGAQASLAAHSRLQRQVDLQYETLRGDLSTLNQRILALTSRSHSPVQRSSFDRSPSEHAPADWEQRVGRALTHAAALDRLAGELRGHDDLPSAMQQRIANAFDGLWDTIYAPEP